VQVVERAQAELHYRLDQPDPKKRLWKMALKDAPPFVHALKMAPTAQEPELNQGTWVIVAFGVFSAPDEQAVHTAFHEVQSLGDQVQLGIRPFWEYEEMTPWFPEYTKWHSTESPLVIVLNDGRVQGWMTGEAPPDRMKRFLETSLKQVVGRFDE